MCFRQLHIFLGIIVLSTGTLKRNLQSIPISQPNATYKRGIKGEINAWLTYCLLK